MYKHCEQIRREGVRAYTCGNPVHGSTDKCTECAIATRTFELRVPMRGRRARAWYWTAFVCGVVVGTPIGLLLEAIRQGAAHGGVWWNP